MQSLFTRTTLFIFSLFFSYTQLIAQSFHTVSFSGNSSDFIYLERRGSNTDHTDYYVTFDQTYLYLAAFRTNGQSFADYDHFTVYIDADPQATPTTGNGSTTGVSWDSNTPTVPFNADYRICLRKVNLGESFFSSYTGGSWTTGGTNGQGWTQYATSQALEVRVPWTDLGNPSAMYLTNYMSYNGGFFSPAPGSFTGSTLSGYCGGIGTTSAGCIPLDVANDPITGSATNVASAGAKYGKLTITSNTTSTGSFTIVNGGSLILNGGTLDASAGNINISGRLNLTNGNVLMGSSVLTVGTSNQSGGEILRTSGAVVGKLKRWITGSNGSRTFPVGTAADYRPATIDFTGNLFPGGSLMAEFVASSPVATGLPLNDNTVSPNVTIDRVAGEGYWKLDPGDGLSSGVIYNATFEGGGFCCVNDVTTLRLIKRATGGSWTLDGTAVNGTGNNIVGRNNMTGFSEFGIGGNSGSNPLPVQLASFTGAYVNGNVRLHWRTLSEINNYGFYVQRRTNGISDWGIVENSFVPGHGTTNEPQNYEFTDTGAPSSALQYRLKQVDLDGAIHFTEPINVSGPTDVRLTEVAPTGFLLKQNYPNPFNPSTEIEFTVEETERATLEVFDLLGRKVVTVFDRLAESGLAHRVRFDANDLSSGVYVYRLQSGRRSTTKKLLLSK